MNMQDWMKLVDKLGFDSSTERDIFFYIYESYSNGKEICNASLSFFERLTLSSRPKVIKSIESLIRKQLICKTSSEQGKRNGYLVNEEILNDILNNPTSKNIDQLEEPTSKNIDWSDDQTSKNIYQSEPTSKNIDQLDNQTSKNIYQLEPTSKNIDWLEPETSKNIDWSEKNEGDSNRLIVNSYPSKAIINNLLIKKSNDFFIAAVAKKISVIVEHWNQNAKFGLRKVTKISEGSKRYDFLVKLLEKNTLEEVLDVIDNMIPKCEFLQGKGDSGWKIDFDWFIELDNFQNIAEGKYLVLRTARQPTDAKAPKKNFENEHDYDFEDYEKRILSN